MVLEGQKTRQQAKVVSDKLANDDGTKEVKQIKADSQGSFHPKDVIMQTKDITDKQDIDHDSHSNYLLDNKVVSDVMGQFLEAKIKKIDAEGCSSGNRSSPPTS